MKFTRLLKVLSLLTFFPIIFSALTGCSSTGKGGLSMASMEGMPEQIRSAPAVVQQSYQFAAANPQVLQHIACYCGCDDLGHTSNYACYVSGVDSAGKITYDDHALGCSICTDITQDVIRLERLGKPLSDIQSYIDQTYSQYGPSNIH